MWKTLFCVDCVIFFCVIMSTDLLFPFLPKNGKTGGRFFVLKTNISGVSHQAQLATQRL